MFNKNIHQWWSSGMHNKQVNEYKIAEHYQHGYLLAEIEDAIQKQGKNKTKLSLEDLALVDEFHIGGRIASAHLLDQLKFKPQQNILDIGCGLGGAARFVAKRYHSFISGIDLTLEYIETGNELSNWLGLSNKVMLKQANALNLPFERVHFDGAYMMHVGMNIKDKKQLFSEVCRVLKPHSFFGIYDVIQQKKGDLIYPVPWAIQPQDSYLASIDEYKRHLLSTGFKIIAINNRRDFAIDFFQQIRAKNKLNGGPPALGIHTIMKTSAHQKLTNLRSSIENNIVAPIEIIVQKC